MSYTQSWTQVDFCQKQHLPKMPGFTASRQVNTWIFPSSPYSALAFLKRYTSGSLKSVYLNDVSTEILQYLKKNCPNLENISILQPLSLHHFPKEIPLPKTIKKCNLCFDYTLRFGYLIAGYSTETMQRCKSLMFRLGNCTNLQRLTFRGIFLSPDNIDGITALSNLREITDLSFLKVHFVERSYFISGKLDIDSISGEMNIALVSLFKLEKLRAFRLSTDNPSSTEYWFNISTFLSAIQDGNWPNLRVLSLAGIQPPSRDIFASMTSAMPQLETLELEGKIITDENTGLIAKYLKNLTSVVFTNGKYTPIGIKGLSGHPSIERFSLLEHNQHAFYPQWLLAVYDVLLSLPQIAYVKLVGYRIIALHAKEQGIPQMPEHVQIDMENSKESFCNPLLFKMEPRVLSRLHCKK